MSDQIESLPGLGPYISRRLVEADISTIGDLRECGSVEAYARLKFRFGREITLNALWAIEAALAGQDWRHIPDNRKQELKAELARRTP